MGSFPGQKGSANNSRKLKSEDFWRWESAITQEQKPLQQLVSLTLGITICLYTLTSAPMVGDNLC
jgi:hypothetical protein